MRASAALFLAAIVLTVGGYACGDGSPEGPPGPITSPTPTPTPVDPAELLRRSGEVMEGLRSFRFELKHPRGGTALLPGLVVQEAQAEVVRPDRISATFDATFGGFAISASLVTIGDTSFMTNPLTGEWEEAAADVSPLGFFDPGQGIAAMMSSVSGLLLLPGDAGVHRVGGEAPAAVLSAVAGTTVPDATVTVELTIDADEFYLVEASIRGAVTPSDDPDVVRLITLSRFDEPISITAPQQ